VHQRATICAPDDVLVFFQIVHADRIGENYFSHFSNQHEWNYVPYMKHDVRALLIKQWDNFGTMMAQQENKEENDNIMKKESSFRSTCFVAFCLSRSDQSRKYTTT